ncbi:MAG: hypothetical protein PUC93_05520 [Oscillospiraceae bacterium]|nr:hypothetical protein [Oscillospiraceae bacterium]
MLRRLARCIPWKSRTRRLDRATGEIFAKKRCIDPYVRGRGRVSELDAGFAAQLHAFRTQSQDYWVRGR